MVDTQVQSISTSPLLNTKFFKPNWRPGSVSRPALISELSRIQTCRLAIVSAPAGFGKTTLLSEWLSGTTLKSCWVSLGDSDNDPIVFWSYIITAIQKTTPSVGDHFLPSLLAPQSNPIQVVTMLLNALSTEDEHLVVVLDDFHLITSDDIHEAVAFFIEYAPMNVHVILSTRSIPPLPLARLRARNELIEIEASSLRFSTEEAASFFNETMKLQLQSGYVEILEQKTEGWIAGLQLAALSLNGRSDIDAFIHDFSGDDRYIIDYLAEEVLQRHPESIRQFLLYTSILNQFNAPLCDAITQQPASTAIIEELEKANLFLVALDNKRNWFRYHHLFGEVLHTHLQQVNPEIVPELYHKACEWHEANDKPIEAIHYALEGKHYEKAKMLLEKTALTLFEHGQNHTLYNLLDKLPSGFDSLSPILTSWYAWRNIDRGDFKLADIYLDRLEKSIAELSPEQLQELAKENKQYHSLPGTLHTARALESQASGDAAGAIKHARQALDLLPDTESLWRGGSIAILGLASWSTGDLDTAFDSFYKGLYMIEGAGRAYYRISGTHVLAEIRLEQGRLKDTYAIYRKSLKMAEELKDPVIKGIGDIYYGLAELAIEHNDLELAQANFSRARALGEEGTLHENKHKQYMIDARIQEAQGLKTVALERMQEAEEQFMRDAVPNPRSIDASKIRLLIALNRLPDAVSWAENKDFSSSKGPIPYTTEYEHIAFVRVLIAQYEASKSNIILEEAQAILQNLETSASTGGRMWNLIVVYLLQSTCLALQSRTPEALNTLQKALKLGEPEKFIRTFLDEDETIHQLLRHAVASNMGGPYARNILSAYQQEISHRPQSITHNLVTPLTKREVEIIRLIAAGMRNQEIADHLFISLSTVKRHIANAYSKLEATHRTEAINRATNDSTEKRRHLDL